MQINYEKNGNFEEKRYPGTAESRNTEERGESPNMIQDYGRSGSSDNDVAKMHDERKRTWNVRAQDTNAGLNPEERKEGRKKERKRPRGWRMGRKINIFYIPSKCSNSVSQCLIPK